MPDLTGVLATQDSTIRQLLSLLNTTGKGIAIIVDAERRLIATVTDGDLRRTILAGLDLDAPIENAIAKGVVRTNPIFASIGTGPDSIIELMHLHGIRHVPLVDEQHVVMDLAIEGHTVGPDPEAPVSAVLMAGGFGTRLRPLTNDIPKPMLPIAGKPILELTIDRLRLAGIQHMHVTTHYRPEVIRKHFGDGSNFGVDIKYVHEDAPLGTAGALSLLEGVHDPVLVINADVLTDVDFKALMHYHRGHGADLTIVVQRYEHKVPYGVVDTTGDGLVVGITEKPTIRSFISAGVYLVNPDVRRFLQAGQHCDMPEFISMLLKEKRRVITFPLWEYWTDIGQIQDYERACRDASVAGRA